MIHHALVMGRKDKGRLFFFVQSAHEIEDGLARFRV